MQFEDTLLAHLPKVVTSPSARVSYDLENDVLYLRLDDDRSLDQAVVPCAIRTNYLGQPTSVVLDLQSIVISPST